MSRRGARIGVGGLMHETNTFASAATTFEDFARAADRPGIVRGDAIPAVLGPLNVGIAGALDAIAHAEQRAVPLAWAAATPGGTVGRAAFEQLASMLLDEVRRAAPLDGLFLELHGAMVAEGIEDGEGEILRRLRQELAPACPIVCSLDLHANVTPAMVELATGLVAYRTYPHIDQRSTGRRAANLLLRALAREDAPAKCFRQLPFLIPAPWQSTLAEPVKSVMKMMEALETGGVESLSFTPGFPAADIYHCAPAVFGYGWPEGAVTGAVESAHRALLAAELDFAGRVYQPADAVRAAMARTGSRRGPVILADTQDNPGGGATSDTIGVLAALVNANAKGAVLAVMFDPAVALLAHGAGVGAQITAQLGAKSGDYGEQPLHASFVVERVTDGAFTCTGPILGGVQMHLGPMALLRIGGVRIIVSSRKMQPMDQAVFRHVGVEPVEQQILVLKSSVHFRADFQDLAEEILVVESPGALLIDLTKYPFQRLRPEIRLHPLGPAFVPNDAGR